MNPEIVDTMVRAAMQVMDNAYVPYGKAPSIQDVISKTPYPGSPSLRRKWLCTGR